jgi:hypothetical protein
MKGTSESTRTRKELRSWLLDVNRRQSSEHGKYDLGCFVAPLVAIFGYHGENIGEHLLEKIGIILLARSSGMRLGTGTQWLDRTGRHSRSFMDSMQWK